MENLKVKHKEEVVDSTKLFTLTSYSNTFGVPLSTVKYQMLAGILKTMEVNGTTLIIREEKNGK